MGSGVPAVLKRYAQRVRSLQLRGPSYKDLQYLTGSFSTLKGFSIVNVNQADDLDLDELQKVLRRARCVLDGVVHDETSSIGPWPVRVTIPSLSYFHLGLHRLSLNLWSLTPALRLAPNWHPLSVRNWKTVAEVFELLPMLSTFRTLEDDFMNYNPLVTVLLPSLRNLVVFADSCPDRAGCETLRGILTARRSQITTFRLTWEDSEEEPDDDILDDLRQLVADEMKIHVGTGEDNYLSE
ncbi:hypothetical protein C8J57DRAFT_1729771 [Mycena rebaudengoi]|nr:hypothetical protein C8J57DRAFT_1729771 [Mycena rebaudengoi]